MAAKQAFEAAAREVGVTIQHYHANNGRFADQEFVQAIRRAGQTISYCRVNAHWQNGRAEKRICDLQEGACTAIIHAKHQWPKAIEPALWPYALRYCADVANNILQVGQHLALLQLFSNTAARPKLRHFHPFGCPVHILDSDLQLGKTIEKWTARACVGLYLGLLPRHARSVALVLLL